MHRRIGILTHYYNSVNYGGILQSYALCKYLNDNGAKAKQVCYDASVKPASAQTKLKLTAHRGLALCRMAAHPGAQDQINRRKKAFTAFRDSIPHTEKVYTYHDLQEANGLFDAFVTGSDQVWHPGVINAGYLLSFSTKPRYSYAASVACDAIPADRMPLYQEALASYAAVSVRERRAQVLLPVEAELVLDPVFLLSDTEWEETASARQIDGDYVFCYFLGDSPEARTAAADFAKQQKLKLVNIPYLKDSYRPCDDGFGDCTPCDVSPGDFLSLILHANYVFTDSFHAICFSFLFQKQFFVFNRKTKANSGTRIRDILMTLDLENRYFEEPSDVLSEQPDIDYAAPRPALDALKQSSVRFVKSMMEGRTNGAITAD